MCRITGYRYTCDHQIEHVWSACRGQIKATKDSNTPACLKSPSLYIRIATKCGSCSRADAEAAIHRNHLNATSQTSESDEILKQQLSAIKIPTTNWCPPPSPVYSRKPSQKRLQHRRSHSLLREEVKAEDTCGPEAWEDNVVLAVYQPVADGWNWEWTAETKSLADEIAEDAVEDAAEECDDMALGGQDASIESGACEMSVPVQYRYRRSTPGRKVWEMVPVH